MEKWDNFYLTASGAAATLTGLLFVALSVNKDPIGGNHEYRSLARQTVISLMSIVVMALIALIPQNPPGWLAAELAMAACSNLVPSAVIQVRTLRRIQTDPRRFLLSTASYDIALLLVLGASWGIFRGWSLSPLVLVLAVLVFGALAMANCWTLVMRVDTPAPTVRDGSTMQRSAGRSATGAKIR